MNISKIGRIVITSIGLSSMAITAKSETAWDIEYLPAGTYDSAIGVGLYNQEQEGFGYYGNFQITLDEREPQYDSLNLNSFGDPVVGRYKELMIFNFGITKNIITNVSAYAGIGFASVTGIAQKDDPSNILAPDGIYYVNDPENDETGGNLNAGIIFGTDTIIFNIGYHSFTSSAYIGIGSRF